MIGAAIGSQVLGGLFGGGPRAPRMNRCHQEQMMQQQHVNRALAMNMAMGANRVNMCNQGFMGMPCGCQNFGPIATAGCGSAFATAGAFSNSWSGGNQFNSLFSPPLGNSFGYGVPYQPPTSSISLAIGVSMNA